MAQCWRSPAPRTPRTPRSSTRYEEDEEVDSQEDAVNVTFSWWTTRKSHRSNNKISKISKIMYIQESKTQFYDVQILPWGFYVGKNLWNKTSLNLPACGLHERPNGLLLDLSMDLDEKVPSTLGVQSFCFAIYLIDWSRLKQIINQIEADWSPMFTLWLFLTVCYWTWP